MKKIFKIFENKIKQALLICLINFISVLIYNSSSAQNSAKQASPSANFSNTFNSSVDLYTGKADVSFNLVNLKFAGEDLNISLKYLGGNGIKADELPSWVGLGWGLNAPGYVYRILRGSPDELQTYKSKLSTMRESVGPPTSSSVSILNKELTTTLISNKNYLTNYSLLNSSDWNSISKITSYKPSGLANNFYSSGWQNQGSIYRETIVNETNMNPAIDLAPDDFVVQIGELSGVFFKNMYGEWSFISNNNLSCKVEVFVENNYKTGNITTPGVINKIVLTSSKGIQYTFDGDFESSKVSTAYQNSYAYPPSGSTYFYDLLPTLWTISKIENLNTHEQIDFSYDPFFYQMSKFNSAFGDSGRIIYENYNNLWSSDAGDWRQYTANYEVAHKTKILKAITCSNGYRIKFNSSLSNQLLSNQSASNGFSEDIILYNKSLKYNLYKLDSIHVYDDNKLIRGVSLKFHESLTDRLQLKSVEFTDGINVQNAFLFDYNQTKLPPYGGRKIDHWGYYNGLDFFTNYPNGPYADERLLSFNNFKIQDPILSKAEMLVGVSSSGQGKTVFEYEPNDYYLQVDANTRQLIPVVGPSTGGGVRIKKIINYDNGQEILSKNYYYNKEDGSSSGILAVPPQKYLTKNDPLAVVSYSFQLAGFSTNITSSSNVTYSRVIEKIQDSLTTISEFTNFDNGFGDQESQIKNFTGVIFNIKNAYQDFSFKRGKLTSLKKMLADQILPVRETVFKYQHDFSDAGHPEYRAIHMSYLSPTQFYYSALSYKRYADLLREVKTINNEKSGSITSIKEYQYDSYNNLIEEKFETSKTGEIKKITYKYPYDFSSSIYQQMVSRNMITPVIETKVTLGSNQTFFTRTNYDSFRVNNLLLPKSIEQQIGQSPLQTMMLFNGYDAIGNIFEQQVPYGVKDVIIWGYKKQYIVAKITGDDFDVVKPLIFEVILDNPSSDQQLIQLFNDLRASLPNSLITSYTYQPLVGMTSETDAKGMTTYYTYDGFGRLENIKDQQGNIVKNYQYHYADGTGTPPGSTTYYNTVLTVSKAKDNCGSGTGTAVNYTVAAGTYSSTISQADADQKAQSDANTNAQNYANAQGSCNSGSTTYYNTVLTVSKTKDNCSSGTGTTVNYVIAAGTYSSTISQADADQKAQTDANTNAQNYANTQGSCSTEPGTTYYSKQVIVYKAKNDCGPGLTGSIVDYGVVYGAFTSTISQADADQKAQNFADANAQNFANSSGTCAITQGNFTLNFSAPETSLFDVYIKDLEGNLIKHLSFIGSHSIPNIPGGTGSITVAAGGGIGVTYSYTINGTTINTSPAKFDGLSLSGTITITVTATSFLNDKLTVAKTRNNCQVGQESSSVNYVVPAYTYSSTISQADANQKAQNDANANAQNYANANGTCTTYYYNTAQTATAVKNDCEPGEVGSEYSYTVAAGLVKSAISQADADQKALDAAISTAQYRANLYGTCSLPVVYYSKRISASKTKNNCAPGETGSLVMYEVYGSKYTSIISQADADQKAQTDFDAIDGQAYANTHGTCTPPTIYESAAVYVYKKRNNCPSGQVGSDVYYASAAGKHTSIISQADADQKAQDDLTANAQNYANANGGCVVPTTYYNTLRAGYFTRNDCLPGQKSAQVLYHVLANKHSSIISQADANQKAEDDLIANGQNYANANGICVTRENFTLNYSLPADREFSVSVYNPLFESVKTYTISGTGSLTNIPGGMCIVDIVPVYDDPTTYEFYLGSSLVNGQNAHYNTRNLTGTITLNVYQN